MHLLPAVPELPPFETERPQPEPRFSNSPTWDAGRFAQEQLRRLVRQVFFPGWPRPARHIAFVAMDERTDTGSICMEVGQILASEIQANTCVVEANRSTIDIRQTDNERRRVVGGNEGGSLREHTQRLAGRLWLLPQESFLEGCGTGLSAIWLESRIQRLHREFDFTLLHLPPVGRSSEAVLLGHLSDGVVLVLEANATRRIEAQRVKEMFQSANVRILGAVLSGRTFPIPEAIYRKL
jgi:hypothetical protein